MAAPKWARACSSRWRRSSPTSCRSMSPRSRSPRPIPARYRTPRRPRRPRGAPTSTAGRGADRRADHPPRLTEFASSEEFKLPREAGVRLRQKQHGDRRRPGGTDEFRRAGGRSAYRARVQLSATGFYKTPKIFWDTRREGRGRAFFYFAYGAAVADPGIDTLTGEYKVLRVDVLRDVGRSINPGGRHGPDRGRLSSRGWAGSPARSCGSTGEGRLRNFVSFHLQDPGLRATCRADWRIRILEHAAQRGRIRCAARRRWGSRR